MTTPGIIRQTPPQGCDLCGEVKELRPYGPRGAWVCFDCGMQSKKTAERQFLKVHGIKRK